MEVENNFLMRLLTVFFALFAGVFCSKVPQGSLGQTPVTPKAGFHVDTLVTDLEVPWGMAFLPGGDLLFTQRNGELRLLHKGKLDPAPITGLPAIRVKGQGGLLDVALHPDFAKNGWIYFTYAKPITENGAELGTTACFRAHLNGHALTNVEEIFEAKPAVKASHHYGSRIAFDRQGMLYLSIGERGSNLVAQSLRNHHGKVIRLFDDGKVPADNPYFGSDTALSEIWTSGHRNPQGMAMNPATGDLWVTEHGPKGGDELNLIQKGHNYGWPVICYGINYDGTILTPDTVKEGMDQPVTFWRPSIAPCGTAFISGKGFPAWKNSVFVGSLAFRFLNRVELEGNTVVHQERLLENIGRVRAIAEGPDGNIYVAVEGPGMIVRLVPGK